MLGSANRAVNKTSYTNAPLKSQSLCADLKLVVLKLAHPVYKKGLKTPEGVFFTIQRERERERERERLI